MDSWKAFTTNVGPLGQKITRQFGNLNQQARERFGTVDADDITELPDEYKRLEDRVDALKAAHTNLLKYVWSERILLPASDIFPKGSLVPMKERGTIILLKFRNPSRS